MRVPRSLPLLALVAVLAGCAPSYVNLTPRTAPRSSIHRYRFEVEWETRRSGANNSEVRAYVVVDQALHPMVRVPNTENRFEGEVPIPGNRTHVPYRFKFDYDYPGLPRRVVSSDWSPEYLFSLPQN